MQKHRLTKRHKCVLIGCAIPGIAMAAYSFWVYIKTGESLLVSILASILLGSIISFVFLAICIGIAFLRILIKLIDDHLPEKKKKEPYTVKSIDDVFDDLQSAENPLQEIYDSPVVQMTAYPKNSKSQVKVESANLDFQQLVKLTDYVVVDTETTGLDRDTDQMIEIAIITVHDGTVTDEYSTFIKPTVPVSAGARAVNGITDAQLDAAPDLAAVRPEIARRLQNQKIVGHNVTFDLAFIARALAGTDGIDTLYYLDTLPLARHCLYYKSYKLQDLAYSLGLDAGTGHRALDDARTTHQLLRYCIKKMVDDDTKRKQEAAEKRRLAKEKRTAQFAWSPLFDKNFVFTGDFLTDREKLQDLLKSVGANLRTEVNSRTVYLVVGDLSHLPDWALARKSGAADARIAKGQPITKLTEAEYINLIQQTLALKK